jgi:tRNA (cytidine/uridine-2'-O-)-methyltransferase
MFHVALFEPEIPPNTGNVIRLCANTGSQLHLIEPLGFGLEDRRLRRAGLDYREFASVQVHRSYETFLAAVRPQRLFAVSTRGTRDYDRVSFEAGDALLFGPETRGLPPELLGKLHREQCLRIPMVPGNRSLNLSNAVTVVLYEAWRQSGFAGARLA